MTDTYIAENDTAGRIIPYKIDNILFAKEKLWKCKKKSYIMNKVGCVIRQANSMQCAQLIQLLEFTEFIQVLKEFGRYVYVVLFSVTDT